MEIHRKPLIFGIIILGLIQGCLIIIVFYGCEESDYYSGPDQYYEQEDWINVTVKEAVAYQYTENTYFYVLVNLTSLMDTKLFLSSAEFTFRVKISGVLGKEHFAAYCEPHSLTSEVNPMTDKKFYDLDLKALESRDVILRFDMETLHHRNNVAKGEKIYLFSDVIGISIPLTFKEYEMGQ